VSWGADGPEFDKLVGRRLRFLRRHLGLSQGQVAEACGVGFQLIQKYESGTTRISAARMWQLAKALGVPVTYFFEGRHAEVRSFLPSDGRADQRPETNELMQAYEKLPEESRQRLRILASVLAATEGRNYN